MRFLLTYVTYYKQLHCGDVSLPMAPSRRANKWCKY